jgi:hypothetical protein
MPKFGTPSKPFSKKHIIFFITMNSEFKKPNSFKLLEEEHHDEFFRIPPMSPHMGFFAARSQSKGQIIEARLLRSIRNYQSAGNMLDTFFSGMVNTAIGMTGGNAASTSRKRPSPDMDSTGAGR